MHFRGVLITILVYIVDIQLLRELNLES